MKTPLAFVAGATGFTGRAVVHALRESDVDTIAHVRPDSPRLDKWQEEFGAIGARVDATPWLEAELQRTMASEKPSLVFALLGTTRTRARSEGRSAKEAYEAVDYGMSVMLLHAAGASARDPCFVYLSSLGADGGKGAYMSARKRVEDETRQSRLPWIIARPPIITGNRQEPRPAERAAGVVVDGVLAAFGALGARSLQSRYRSTTDEELARRLVKLALDPSSFNAVYEGASLKLAAS